MISRVQAGLWFSVFLPSDYLTNTTETVRTIRAIWLDSASAFLAQTQEFWTSIFKLLASNPGGEEFQLQHMRSLLGNPEAEYSATAFSAVCSRSQRQFCIVVDEASALAPLAATEEGAIVVDEFLYGVRTIKNDPRTMCKGIILLGVHSVINLLSVDRFVVCMCCSFIVQKKERPGGAKAVTIHIHRLSLYPP